MAFGNQPDSIVTRNDIPQSDIKESKSPYAQIICFVLIVIMNLGGGLGLISVFTELPLMIPLTPESWTLPAVLSICDAVTNLVPAIIIFLRWYQGKRFSEIPYIYVMMIVEIIACCLLSIFWQKTIFVFGRERSLWLIGSFFFLSMQTCTSSLVFFDYIKRFRSQYLTAVFLSEALMGAIPTLLLLIQGIGGEAICVESNNGTISKTDFTQSRFSVRVYMFITIGIIVLSLIAFLLLRWTNIISLANATEPVKVEVNRSKETSGNVDEILPMTSATESVERSKPSKQMIIKPFAFLLFLNALSSFMLQGVLPSLTTYILLPYGQKAFYYSSLLSPLGYLIATVISIRCGTITIRKTIIGTIFGCTLGVFMIIIATQSPCPWWADSLHGALIMIFTRSLTTVIIAYIRITIGNRIKVEWSNEKGMFYFGVSDQLGSLIGTIPIYLLIDVFNVFIDRKPCQSYCIT